MKNTSKIRVLFLARSLDSGGTERQLVTLAGALDKSVFDVTVCLFYRQGALLADLENAPGVRIADLKKKGRWDAAKFFARFVGLLRKIKPHVVYSMLPAPNLAALAGAKPASKAKIVWGVRASRREMVPGDLLPAAIYALEARLSRFCDLVIANSQAGRADIIQRGFLPGKVLVIENGINTGRFRFDPEGRQTMRKAWGAGPDEVLAGLAANVRPVKGHSLFMEAAARAVQSRPDFKFVCIGGGDVEGLRRQADGLGLGSKMIWAGPCRDMPAAYSALDILCSASEAEGFSNVIAEAMSCQRPCVVTDVGDSAHIVGGTGLASAPGDPEDLARELVRMVQRLEQEPDLPEKARLRIVSQFDTSILASRTANAMLGLVRRPALPDEKENRT